MKLALKVLAGAVTVGILLGITSAVACVPMILVMAILKAMLQ